MTHYISYKPSYYATKKANGFDSKFEAKYAEELELRKRAKDIKDYECQKTLDLIVNGYLVCTYKIDFIVYHNDGMIEYAETKGYATDVFKLKWKLFEALYSSKENTKLSLVYQGKKWQPKLRKCK